MMIERRSATIHLYPQGVCVSPHRGVGAAGAKVELRGKERPLERDETAAPCGTFIAPGVRCGHPIEDHDLHGSAALECWRCEDWHTFVLSSAGHPPERRRIV